MKLSGAEIFVECLKREKAEVMFGICGGAVLPIFDKLYDAPIRFILTRHEQAASHMADGYARATGKAGVCMATSGPGATNLVTGLATAYMDSIPVVAFTGQVATPLIGNDAFQEADTTGITRPVTKHNYLVKDVKNLARIIREAFCIARSGRPGPVLVDLPVDVQRATCEFEYPKQVQIRGYKPTYQGHPKQVERALERILKAERPVLYVGGGIIISGASEELFKFVQKTHIPVTTTLLGIGAFPTNHLLSLQMLGMHGTIYANYAMQNADLIIAIGARFDDRITGKIAAFAPKAKIVHIDIDPTSIGKNVPVEIPVVGDAKNVLQQMNKLLGKKRIKPRKDWLAQVNSWKQKYPLTYKKTSQLQPQWIIEQIYKITRGKAIIATEVGQNQMWAAQYYQYTEPRTFLSSGGLGTMGYGFPAALGAKVGRPDKIVIDIAGDGSIQMNIQELATAVINKIPVKVAILNNRYLGMVRQWQELFYHHRYSAVSLEGSPDFARVAAAYGAVGICVKEKREVGPAIKKALRIDKPVFIDFQIYQEENVFPMVPAGAPLDEIIGKLA